MKAYGPGGLLTYDRVTLTHDQYRGVFTGLRQAQLQVYSGVETTPPVPVPAAASTSWQLSRQCVL